MFSGFAAPPTTAAAAINPDGPQCDGRLLASPIWDIGKPVVFGDLTQSASVQAALDALGHKHGPLSDVIAIDSGQVRDCHILLWVNRALLHQEGGRGTGLMVHFLDAGGALLGTRPVVVADRVSLVGLPARWTDLAGPWFPAVYHAVLYGATRLTTREPVRVSFDPPPDTAVIEIGVRYENDKQAKQFEQHGRPFYVAAIELTSFAEQHRSDYDQTQIQRNRSVVESFLGPASGDIALLFPGKTYRVTTTAEVTARDDEGNEESGGTQSETFWFRTDAVAPKRLDPWLLCSTPAENEAHVFGHEEIKIVFATNDVDKLYAAYGRELRARLKAASFRQVDEPGVPHPFPIDATTLENVAGQVLSPFEHVLAEVIAARGKCIPVDEERVRHSALTIPIPLDPYTDYVLDIESVPVGAAANAVGERVLRRAFSTGGFTSLEAFALDFRGTLTEHRAVAPGVMQAIGNDPRFAARDPEGQEFDEALIAAGLEPMPVPRAPRIVIFWEQANAAAVPQPAAVLLDGSEPMHRTRALPQEVTSTDPQPVKRWTLTEQAWVTLEQAASGGDVVDKIVFAPGRQRALLTLKPGSRDAVLHLELVRQAFTAPYLDGAGATPQRYRIVSETLKRAPWEED